jgi:peptidoglycan/LPS O-acetylase OafA/YrhL
MATISKSTIQRQTPAQTESGELRDGVEAPAIACPSYATDTRRTRIPTLDGWRGLAILLVLVGHIIAPANSIKTQWIIRIGQHGVAIFFVLSGFLITSLLLNEKELTGTVDLGRFYLRRFFRLMPCTWIYLATVTLIFMSASVRQFTSTEILGSLFFFRNYVNPSGSHPITGHFWSLSIEEQFYLVWPALLLLLGSRRSRWFCIATACCIAVWRWMHWTEVSLSGFGYSIRTEYRADALIAGCAMALLLPSLRPYLRSWMALPLALGVTACLPLYPDLVPLRESVLIAMLLAVTSQCRTSAFRMLDWKPLAFLGTISYSIYIWQQPFMISSFRGMPLSVSIPTLCLFSLVSYYLIEKPVIRLGRHLEDSVGLQLSRPSLPKPMFR